MADEVARFVGGPMDGEGVEADPGQPLPEMVAADGGEQPVCYRLVRHPAGGEGQYVVDDSLIEPFLQQLREEHRDG